MKKKTPDTESGSRSGPEPDRLTAPPPAPTPPASVRVNTDTLDRLLGTVGEVILSSSQLRTAARGARRIAGMSVGLDRMDRVVGELQRRALDLRTTPLLRIVEPLPRMARELATRLGKRVEVEISGAEIELDRSILDRLSDPLVHLVRNALDHGIESPPERVAAGKSEIGRISIDAVRVKDSIHITVGDDGAGIDLEAVKQRAISSGLVVAAIAEDLSPEQLASFVFSAGLSTADSITEVSGRGVGMDAVRATVESLGGEVQIVTQRGGGTTTMLIVPITAAVQRVLLLAVSGETVAVPVSKIERVIEVAAEEIERSGFEAFVLVDDCPVAVIDLASRLSLPETPKKGPVTLVLGEVHGELMALEIDHISGHQQIYVKPVPELLAPVRVLAGLTILGDGTPVFVLDLNQLS